MKKKITENQTQQKKKEEGVEAATCEGDDSENI